MALDQPLELLWAGTMGPWGWLWCLHPFGAGAGLPIIILAVFCSALHHFCWEVRADHAQLLACSLGEDDAGLVRRHVRHLAACPALVAEV